MQDQPEGPPLQLSPGSKSNSARSMPKSLFGDRIRNGCRSGHWIPAKPLPQKGMVYPKGAAKRLSQNRLWGALFQPFVLCCDIFTERCPRLTWIAPLAIQVHDFPSASAPKARCYTSLGRSPRNEATKKTRAESPLQALIPNISFIVLHTIFFQ